MTAVISAKGLRKTYGSFEAVSDVSFEVHDGEIFGILGPNGAGKTTTVECVQGLRTYEGGSVTVLGLDPRTHAVEIRKKIGSQLQESALPDRIRVWEALDLFGSLSSAGPSSDELLDDWGLSEKRAARFGSLSGGQQQRLFVALALVNDPKVVFLDEMTTGLDPASRRVAWELIGRIRERGTTVVLVTHFMDEAEALCDRLVVIDRGRVSAEGSPRELVDRYGGGVRVRFTADGPDLSWLSEVSGVREVIQERGRYEVHGEGPLLAYVAAALVSRGFAPTDLRAERATLEDVFLSLTQGSGEQG
ncbi:MAG TPA: ABC transporter ATP-binding protein [Acidimicrobiia bacterium]|jgi:ABC-2 type transport system ATP-binding protein|nr:ABC transporter ATP-binding protein [Acidimicrobiia bacterium]